MSYKTPIMHPAEAKERQQQFDLQREIDAWNIKDNDQKMLLEILQKNNHFHKFNRNCYCYFCGLTDRDYMMRDSERKKPFPCGNLQRRMEIIEQLSKTTFA